MFLKIITFFAIIGIFQAIDNPIGNYSQYIGDYSQCGLSSKSDSGCFEYHNIESPAIFGREGHKDEAPWYVLLTDTMTPMTSFCGGALISEEWVITAAHCLFIPEGRLKLYVEGVDEVFNAKVRIRHKGFNETEFLRTSSPHDIALLKLNNPVKAKKGGNVRKSHTICLPDRNFKASIRMNQGGTIIGRTAGYAKAMGVRDTKLKFGTTAGLSAKFDLDVWGLGNPRMMWFKGDSGSPIWVYHMGRAILVGVLFGGKLEGDSYAFALFVPRYIDWIINVTSQN